MLLLTSGALAGVVGWMGVSMGVRSPGAFGADWSTYLASGLRDAASPERILSAANVANLSVLWSYHTGASVVASPAVSGGVVYVGSWDGYEYALDAGNGSMIWRTFAGSPHACYPVQGISSGATVANGLVYFGGGNNTWYALRSSDGSVAWSVPTGSSHAVAGGHYNWASPLLYGNSAYIGISSDCDHPLVQGELLQVSLAPPHVISHVFRMTPNGTVGASVWGSPSVDPRSGTVFVPTGNPLSTKTSSFFDSLVALSAATLRYRGSWQVPPALRTVDGDFGATPAVVTTPSGSTLVVLCNKDGMAFAFNATNVSRGPLWATRVSSQVCLAPAAFGAGLVFVGAGNTTLGGVAYPGALRALNVATGKVVWSHPWTGAMLAAPAYVNGLVIGVGGDRLEVLNAMTGATLFTYLSTGYLHSAVVVSHGHILFGSSNGNVTALGIPGLKVRPGVVPAAGGSPGRTALTGSAIARARRD